MNAVVKNGLQAARSAGLRYVSSAMPGYRRIGTRKIFRYLDTNGRVIRDPKTIRRIQRLAIPPAWTGVWICPIPEGHLQAVGRDARGRKQYRYHPQWRQVRDETKYDRMSAFAHALPKIRRRVARDLRQKGLTRDKVLATVVRLLETTFIRIGNKEYTRQNDTFGLTTLRARHVDVRGHQVRFFFRGKSGIRHAIDIEDVALAKIVRRLRDLPGYELFRYYDDDGQLLTVGSADVNQYIRDASGDDFTAKDFRTWAGTLLALEALSTCSFQTSKQAQRHLKAAVESVARRLGNTVAVCKRCYVHPGVLEAYLGGSLAVAISNAGTVPGLTGQEAAPPRF